MHSGVVEIMWYLKLTGSFNLKTGLSVLQLGHIQAQTGPQRFATVSGLNDMFPGNGVQQGLRYVFSCLVGVLEMSAQSAAACI